MYIHLENSTFHEIDSGQDEKGPHERHDHSDAEFFGGRQRFVFIALPSVPLTEQFPIMNDLVPTTTNALGEGQLGHLLRFTLALQRADQSPHQPIVAISFVEQPVDHLLQPFVALEQLVLRQAGDPALEMPAGGAQHQRHQCHPHHIAIVQRQRCHSPSMDHSSSNIGFTLITVY